jgi:hypothetical protein
MRGGRREERGAGERGEARGEEQAPPAPSGHRVV